MGGASLFEVGDDVEYWRVLINLSILAFCLVLLEGAVHRLEHKFPPSEKYQHMLKKTYRELMVLGLISFGLKMLKEVPSFDSYSKTILAFQVADLTIFLLALALVLQSTAVFFLLHGRNNRAERAELMTTQDLVNSIKDPNDARPAFFGSLWCCSRAAQQRANTRELIQHRLLRRLFLRRFGLPQLFPFSKYLNQAQANQIAHMIEVDASMWAVLLVVAWAVLGLLAIIQAYHTEMDDSHKLVEALAVFAWLLLLLQVAVFLYLRSCVHQLLQAAAFSNDEDTLAANLSTIANEETETWQNEEADRALETMGSIQEYHEELALQRQCHRRLQHLQRHRRDGHTDASALPRTRQASFSGVVPGSPVIAIRSFSPKTWHLGVMLLLVLNGFLLTLFFQCVFYDMDDMYHDFGSFATAMVPLPLVLNTFVLQRRIFYDYVVVSRVLAVDAHTLSDVIENFRDVVRLRTEFAASLLHHLTQQEFAITDLDLELRARDRSDSGFIEVDALRDVLAAFGYALPRFRFNSVAKLLFELEGTTVCYAHVVRLVRMAQHELVAADAVAAHPMLRPSSALLYDDANGLAASVRSQSHYNVFNSTRQPLPPPAMDSSGVGSHMGSMIKPYAACRAPATATTATTATNETAAVAVPVATAAAAAAAAAPRASAVVSARALHDMFNLELFAASDSHLGQMQL